MEIRAHTASGTSADPCVIDKVMWISDSPPSGNVISALKGSYGIVPKSFSDNVWDDEHRLAVVLMDPVHSRCDQRGLETMLERLERADSVGLLFADEDSCYGSFFKERDGQSGRFVLMSPDSSPDEISGAIRALVTLQPCLSQLAGRMSVAENSELEFSGRMLQIEEEMRLAASLQRDFLPGSMPRVSPVSFSVMFRPAGWVSGDIYEAARLDENRLGFYVADAVGHGMPAALLTMFIKRALPTKRISGDHYEIVEPADAMRELNTAICEQQLSSCQFCSAFYAILDTQNLELIYSRGGHPEPILQRNCGVIETLDVGGGLLGVFPESDFEQGRIKLRRGDRVMLFSDGAEAVFRSDESCGRDEFVAELLACRSFGTDMAALQLAGILDDMIGDKPQEDDITVLIMDIDP